MIRSFGGLEPRIHADAFVSEAAYVTADVEIGAGSNVWPSAVIRGDHGKIVIGRNTSIQDNSTVHSERGGATIGDNVVIGHQVLCHALRVGDNVVIGNGAIVNGGAEIGENSIIAAGAVVLENAKVPPNTLMVGVPAVAKGQVTAAQIARFRSTVEHYAAMGQQYKAEGLDSRS
jgi:carbonic anhydrase/acetyltransferase-like protein (isoleucine patch superfamily)